MIRRKGSSVSYLKIKVSNELQISQLLILIRRKVDVEENESIVLLMNDKVVPKPDMTVAEIAGNNTSPDGCLHISAHLEKT
eukprot:CAMPEP_0168343894 /NCGR_PEP_ID=MMETSP0213-20121227/16437_1 /TAXON_ID=151035 /ORGANISM="Euplotes harpa, Strain FSP1.4" /LENGTH=80 /DNA_ID=CAMNT_0008351421 /DNA_START=178 /DNA_END=416 /DNA_ORIENTATION=+